ncbi:MAG TPA: carboxypeptidase-like regulatory domain-containing protein [Stenomitos sp.]
MSHPRLRRMLPRLVPLAAGFIMLTASGCPWGQTPEPTGSVAPTAVPTGATVTPSPDTSLNRQVFVSGPAIVNGMLTVKVVRAGSPDRLADCTVSLSGPTPAWGITDSSQDMPLAPLEGGSYSLQVSAPGYATRLVESLTIDPQNPTSLTVELTPQAGKAVGRVVDQNGPIAGARITSGPCVAFTGSDGRYALEGLPAGTSTLAIAKTGYAATTTSVTVNGQDSGVPDVTLTGAGRVIAFENPAQTFDSLSDGSTRSVATALAPLRSALGTAGFTVQDDATSPDIRVVVCPTSDFASSNVERLRSFVAAGGKLVLLGEWGGALRYNPEALNRIATPFGLAFNADLVRSSQNAGELGWVKVPASAGPMPIVDAMPQGITLFESGSLFVLPTSQGILYAGSGGYRIAAVGSGGPCMAAARSYGSGMVVGVGDTSAWTAGSITGNQPVNGNLGETNNREFMLNLFRW